MKQKTQKTTGIIIPLKNEEKSTVKRTTLSLLMDEVQKASRELANSQAAGQTQQVAAGQQKNRQAGIRQARLILEDGSKFAGYYFGRA